MLSHTQYTKLSQLKGIPIVGPTKPGFRWKGISHYDLAKGLIAELKLLKCEVGEVLSQTSSLQSGVTGCIVLKAATLAVNFIANPCIGFCASNDGRHKLSFYVGFKAGHFGYVSSTFDGPKYTYGVDWESACKEAVMEATLRLANDIPEEMRQLSKYPVSQGTLYNFFIRAAEKGIVGWSGIEAAKQIFMDKSEPLPKTMLGALLALSVAIGGRTPVLQMEKHLQAGHLAHKTILKLKKATRQPAMAG